MADSIINSEIPAAQAGSKGFHLPMETKGVRMDSKWRRHGGNAFEY